MTALAFQNVQRPALFNPKCLFGHELDRFELLCSFVDVIFIDRNGWLRTYEGDFINMDKALVVSAPCTRCVIEDGRGCKWYGWRLLFTGGVLLRAEPLPVSRQDIEEAQRRARPPMPLYRRP